MNQMVMLLKIGRKQWRWLAAGILLGVVVILANTFLMALAGWFIASMAMAGVSGVSFNYFTPSAGIRFLAIARTVGRYVERLVTHEAAFRYIAELRSWLFTKIEPLAPAGLERYGGGDVAGRLRGDVDSLEAVYLRVIAPVAAGLLTVMAAIMFMACFSPMAAMILLFFLAVSGIVLPLLVRHSSVLPGRQSAELVAELRNRITEGVEGAEELILFGAVDRQATEVDGVSMRLVGAQERLARINGWGTGGMVFLAGSAVAAILVVGSREVAEHLLPPPSLVMLLLFSAAVFEAIAQFPSALNQFPAVRESARRIMELVEAPVPVSNPDVESQPPTDFRIRFSNVTASYLPGRPVLRNFSLDIPAGGRVAISGASGVGKSLLVDILLRFRDYDGSITIGGVELRSMSRETVAKIITAVPQNPHLFNATIRDNILLGNPDFREEDLARALQDSGLSEWIDCLPGGLDTRVGINGAEVSGGEARRIALARALMKTTQILLLDEPTEGLDIATEQAIIKRLAVRSEGVTLLVISHRPACLVLGNTEVTLSSPSS
jgi:ATP-binding cassette, subfamily C, bacterial CydC